MTQASELPAHLETGAPADARVGTVRAYLSLLLLVVGVVSWRRRTYFDGGFDPVVVIKAMLVTLAVLLAITIPKRVAWERLPTGILAILIIYSVETTVGGWASGSIFSAAVLSVRLLLTASVIIVLVAKYEGLELFAMLRNVMLAVGLVSMATGGTSTGRLTGGIPPLSPNELALLFGVTVLSLAWTLLHGNGPRFGGLALVLLLAAVFLTGSRTGLAFLIVALIAMVVQCRRVPIMAFFAAVAVIPAMVYIIGATGVVSTFADRGGEGNITTLSSRTIAWSAAFDQGDNIPEKLFGGGLALKQIPVAGQYWNQQTLDSTWISALVQGGYLGVVLLIMWVFAAMGASFRSARPERLLWTSLLIFVVGRSFLESGMLDSTAAFLVFFTVCLVGRRPFVSRRLPPVLATPPGG
jgi:hypothetical protein